MSDFKTGDTVRLKSGSPLMTISRFYSAAGGKVIAECIWFDGVEKKSGDFPVETLEPDDGGPVIA
ncbi:YodC family protein [Xanthobacter flavus]|uniref:YodC family protein n=1 Tax=Xanthobacter flavus TaxID=281 RepID=UPI001AE6CAFC|nr:DUF2158 domain-containing protein [Xanthobacter flavus]MBP2147412.1 uncharacterized protein YodC (DUF2158 family) [Xanthobacter flavus]